MAYDYIQDETHFRTMKVLAHKLLMSWNLRLERENIERIIL